MLNKAINREYKNKKQIVNGLFFFIIFLIIMFLMVSSFLTYSIQDSPSYALTSSDITDLEDGQGLKEGANRLRLSYIAEQTLSVNTSDENKEYSKTIIIDANDKFMSDLHIAGTLNTNIGEGGGIWPFNNYSAKYSPDAVIKNQQSGYKVGLILETYPREGETDIVMNSRISVSDTLKNAILDPMLNVTANIRFETKYIADNESYGDATLKWSYDNSFRSEQVMFFGNNNTSLNTALPIMGIDENSYLEFKLENLYQNSTWDGMSKSGGDTFDYTKSGICINFDSIYIDIEIDVNPDLTYRQTLPNFSDVTIEGENRDEDCARDFVKLNDIIEISTNFCTNFSNYELSYDEATDTHYVSYETYNGTTTVINEFRNYYITGSDTSKTSTIEWDYNKNFLERITDDGNFDITGQTARFRVNYLDPNVTQQLKFTPFLRQVNTDYPDDIIGLSSHNSAYVTLRGDAASPYEPQINSADPFYQDTFIEKKWYSKDFVDDGDRRGVEISTNMTSASFNNGQGSRIKVFYTTDGSNPSNSEERTSLLDEPITASTPTNVKFFFPMLGSTTKQIFTLKLVAYDLVGNMSAVVTYDELKFDCTDYYINVYFVQGNNVAYTLANTGLAKDFGYAQLGRYASEYNRDYSSTRNAARRSYRRGELAYIRLTLKKASSFRLIQYYNSGIRNIVNSNINYENFADFDEKNATDVYHYAPGNNTETAIELTDEMVDDINSLNFYFYFKEYLNIYVGATERVYDGLPKSIDQPTTNSTGIDIVTYYKQNAEDEFISTDKFTNAGNYFYKSEIIDINYFGSVQGPFTIHKADPFITELEVLDIVYGNPMSNAIIRCKNTDPNTQEVSYNSYYSSDRKVMGEFMITYPFPSEDSPAYNTPTQGLKDITVTFYPDVELEYDMNYNAVSFQTTLYVEHSKMLIMNFEESSMSYTFQKDTKRYASVLTTPPNQMLIYEYKREGQPDSAYTTSEPIDAGTYEVRVRTDLSLSNYDNMITTENTDTKFIINRQQLKVITTPVVAYYQKAYDPVAQAYLETPEGDQLVPISDWKYEYEGAPEGKETFEFDAGNYQVKVIIDSEDDFGVITGNYVGETTTTLQIKKGNADETTEFDIIYPQPINNPTIRGHIAYGQKLSEISLTTGSGYVAKYPKGYLDEQENVYYDLEIVEGQFIVADRLYNPAIDASVEAFINTMNNKVKPASNYTSTTALYITFIPVDDSNNPDITNFDIITKRVNITIVRATPTFNNVVVEDLIYGNIAADVIFPGFIKEDLPQPIFTITETVTIGDTIINPTANGMPITGKLYYIDQVNKIFSAGQQLITFRFEPDDEDNIRSVSPLNISVNVKKAMLELEAQEREELGEGEDITRIYGSQFVNPLVNIYKNIGGNRIKDNSYNLNYVYKDSEQEIVSMSALSPTGTYTMTVSIVNNNYQGVMEETIIIEKALPALHTAPQAGVVRYGMDMTNVILSNGRMQHPVTYYTIAGAFEFDGIPPVPMQVGELEYAAIFIPTDTNNYESVNITVRIRVQKAQANISLSNLVHTYTGEIQTPSYTTNIVIRTDGEEEYYVNLSESELTEFDRYLAVELRYNTSTGEIPVTAGQYTVTARINDACYEGTYEDEYIINQADALIIVNEESKVQTYNGGIISLSATATDMGGENINALIAQTFTSYNDVELQDAPRDVGIYTVRLQIIDTNYRGTAVSTLKIRVSQIYIHNTIQTYGLKTPVLVEYLPNTASSTVSYQRILDGGEYGDITQMQPTNAGKYKIIIEFTANLNNGYAEVFEGEMTINKAPVTLSYDGVFEYKYRGEQRPESELLKEINNKIRITPNPIYTLKMDIKFFDNQIDEFTDTQPENVGSYIMKATIDDNNYIGEMDFDYIINKAEPTISMSPTVDTEKPIIYTDDGTAAEFVGGNVQLKEFIEGREIIFINDIPGTYSLEPNITNFAVGSYTVKCLFMPDDYHNLKQASGDVNIEIIPKDIGDLIVFNGESSVEYNAQTHYITASILTGENVNIEIFYNGSKAAPRERGTYTVTAEIVDANYIGDAVWEKELVINVGEPLIVAPYLTPIDINRPLSDSQIQGGYAYIKGTGEFVDGELVKGTATVIPGTFSFIDDNIILTQANFRNVQLSFRPIVSGNFSNITFYAEIRVIGTDPIIGDVVAEIKEEGQTIYYGQSLNNFNIDFINTPSGATEGILSFVNNDYIPEVGELVDYRFVPTNSAVYNIVEGKVAVALQKAQADVNQISAKAFYGQTLHQAVFDAVMTSRVNENVAVDGDFVLTSVENYSNLSELLTVNNVAAVAEIINGTPTLQGTYKFTSNNYEEITGSVTIGIYQLVNDINISIQNSSKNYNALPITVEEMSIKTSFTQHPLYDENYIITIFDQNGNLSDGINVGVYTIIIEIADTLYYGSKTVSFEIVKADISSYLSISYTSAEYGSAMTKPTVELLSDNFGQIEQSNFVVEFKKATETNLNSYNETMPSQAGIYHVRVSVVNHIYLSGQKVLTFTIEKQTVQVVVNGMTQYYGNAQPLFITSVEYNLVPVVTYHSSVYNRTTTVPTEAGDYYARVEVIDPNYTIKNGENSFVEVSYKILPATLTLRDKPVLSSITYGQKLKDSRIEDEGDITYGDSGEIRGKYEFINPNNQPYAGQRSVSLIFIPYNKNFSTLRIDDVPIYVSRANAEIIFTNINTVYDGTNRKDEIKYVSDKDVEWEIEFLQDGNVVNPINAGIYQILVRVLSDNYQLGVDIQNNPILEKTNVATFVIQKASVRIDEQTGIRDYTPPIPTPIIYGQSLAYSTLNRNEFDGFGLVYYKAIGYYQDIEGSEEKEFIYTNVDGEFRYINEGLVLGDVGIHKDVSIIFNPTDSNNYNSFRTKIDVEVLPALATITVSNNFYTYGTPITLPTFRTNPGNLEFEVDDKLKKIIEEMQILDCGVYTYTVEIISPNYELKNKFVEFDIIVQKKEVNLEFVRDGQSIEKYFTTYNKILYAKAMVNVEDIVMKDLDSQTGINLNQRITYNYYSVPKSDDQSIIDYGLTPPSDIGSYRVVAVMDHNNYYGSASIYYDINLGEIEEIHFDSETLEKQVYGNVAAPIITTKPAKVAYWIDYQGYGQVRPTAAGTYNIVVYFNDPNYVPKHVSAMFKIQQKELKIEDIVVDNKVYDGVAALNIEAKINGVLLGDEVNLQLKARTKNGKTNVGRHNVEITQYTISGLSSNNYYLAKPYYAGIIEIYERKVTDSNSQSYITSSKGFTEGLTVEFKEIDSPNNRENFFTNILGQKASVQSFLIKQNGIATTLDERVKVYVKIPDEYLDVKNLNVDFLGDLANQNIQPKREGDYITFYTDSSGDVVVSSNDFSYWVIGAISVVVVFIAGIVILFWLNPRHRKSKTSDDTDMKSTLKKIKKGKAYYK